MVFRYRAIKKSGYNSSDWYTFTIHDCPAILWDDTIFLAGKSDSPILVMDSFVRGHPTINMFEGDYVCSKENGKELGIVVYNNGFVVQKSIDGEQKSISHEHIYMRQGDKSSIRLLNTFKGRTPIQFKCAGIVFDIGNFVSIKGSILTLIANKKAVRVNLNEASELLFVKDKEHLQFEGDYIDGNFLSLDIVSPIIYN